MGKQNYKDDPQKESSDHRHTNNAKHPDKRVASDAEDPSLHSRTTLDSVNQQHWLELNGLDATAEVLAITDTGTQIGVNPVLLLTLKVQPAMIATDFKTTGKSVVPRLAIPHVGDTLKLKYNPANPAQFIIL